MNAELLTHIKEADEEQREKLREWLSKGMGHSTMTPDFFTSRGIPDDFVNERCSREWSNFVFAPDNCLKVASAAHDTYRPIGLFEEYGKQRWKYLITPRDMEAGHSVFYDTPRTHETVWIDQSEWSEFMNAVKVYSSKDYDESIATLDRGNYAEEYGEIIGRYIDGELNNVSIGHRDNYLYQVKHWHEVWSCNWDETGGLRIEMGINVKPSQTDGGEDFVYERKDFIPYLTRMEGGRRLEFINVSMAYNYIWYEKGKGVDMEEIEKTVDEYIEKFKDENLVSVLGGKEIATPEQWRSLSREELIQMHVDDREKELDFYHDRQNEWEVMAPGVSDYVRALVAHERAGVPFSDSPPKGWGLEYAQPMGYTDCMWRGNYFVPWVDGSGSSSMMTALCNAFDIDSDTGHAGMGRGSHGRALGEKLLDFLKEEEVWGEEE